MRCALVAVAILLCAPVPPALPDATRYAKLNKLNVVALDAQGQPATGLTRADFQLFEDGKRQDIAFLRFTGSSALKTKPRPGEYSNRARASWHPTVILIDLLSERMVNDSIIGRQVADSLKNLESSDALYLYMLTARGELYPVRPLPKPGAEVAADAEPWTRNIAPMLQTALKDLVRVKPIDDRDIKIRFDLSMHALRELRARMAQACGRKNLVWVTRGIPIVGFSASTQSGLDFTYPLRWFGEELSQAQIVMYTVDQSVADAGTAIGTLDEFTSITGGRGYSSGRAGDAIQQALKDSRANYQIAYYSAELKPDGKHHKIRVSCERKEVRLQTEHGFYDLAPLLSPSAPDPGSFSSRELPVEIETAALSPFDASEIGLRVNVSSDSGDARKRRLEVHIDAADLLPRPMPEHFDGKVLVAFLMYDEGLRQGSRPVVVSLTPEQLATAAHGEISLGEVIPVAPAMRKIRVIAFDAALGAVGSVTIPIPQAQH